MVPKVAASKSAASTRAVRLPDGPDNAARMTNFSTSADPRITARLRSNRTRSGCATSVFSSRTNRKTSTKNSGSPLRGVSIASTCDPAARRRRDRLVDGDQALAKQHIVAIEPPPPLAVVRVRDVELRHRIALSGIRAQQRRPRLDELVATEEPQPVGKRLRIDLVDADNRREPARHLRHCLRLRRVQPGHDGRIRERRYQPNAANDRLTHRTDHKPRNAR